MRVISLCETVERRGINPFEVEVKEVLDSLRLLLTGWKSFEELCLDAEAINNLSKVVKLQGEWIKRRSALHGVDPETVESRVAKLKPEELAGVFLGAWHPLVRLEKLSLERLKEAFHYWKGLPPRGTRGEDFPVPSSEVSATMDDVLKMISEGENFNQILQDFWEELCLKAKETGGRISYWDFVKGENFAKLVARAYLTSFLLTYGYAQLEVDPLEGDITLIPNPEPAPKENIGSSVAIALDRLLWEKLKGAKP